MKTVLYLNHTARLGGGEIALLNLVSALDRKRYRPVILLASEGPLADRLRAAGVETHVQPLPVSVLETRKDGLGLKSLLRMRQAWACVRYAGMLAGTARRLGADLIHTNSLKSDLYGGVAGRLAGIPVLWHVRDSIAAPYLPSAVASLFRRLAHVLPTMVVANSESTLRTLRPAGRGFRVVHDGCPMDQFKTGEFKTGERVGNTQAEPVVALIGRISHWKGQHVFLQAAAQVRDRFPQARFQVIGAALFGEDEYERSLHKMTEDVGLTDTVEFLGFRDDVPALLARADVLVHASILGEPFGQVVIEAMAAGKPVIATEGGAIPEIVLPGETGLLVPMGDAPALAGAIADLLSDPARRAAMGEAGRERVRRLFTIAHTARKVEEVYASLLSSREGVPLERACAHHPAHASE